MKRLVVHITRDVTELFPAAEWGDDEDRILRCLAEQMSPEDVLDGAKWSLERRTDGNRTPVVCPVGPDELRMLYPAHRLADLALMWHVDTGRVKTWLQEAGIEVAHHGVRRTTAGIGRGLPWR